MFRSAIFILSTMVGTASVAAQDIAPVITPGQAANGIFHRSRMEEQAKRIRSRQSGDPAPGTPEFQRRACANRPMFRRQHGADHPQVRRLDQLCKASGY